MDDGQTLYEFRGQAAWWKDLGWDDEQLQRIPVHVRQNPDQDFLLLPAVFGPGGQALYVYRSELPERIWDQLSAFVSRRGEPSGYKRGGMLSGSQERFTDWEDRTP